jgi:hypothetical protein
VNILSCFTMLSSFQVLTMTTWTEATSRTNRNAPDGATGGLTVPVSRAHCAVT